MNNKKEIFKKLGQLADAIVAMFGSNCEVAVHDLADPEHSLVHIAGNVTGRQIGAPATDLLIKNLSINPQQVKDILNYRTTTRNGRAIKSSTVFLRNGKEEIQAAFCINFDTTAHFNAAQLLNDFISTADGKEQPRETFSLSTGDTINAVLDQTILELGKQPATMTTGERLNFTSLLEEQGIFQMKGAVKQVAERIGVSPHTVYNYLKIIRKNTSRKKNGEEHEQSDSN